MPSNTASLTFKLFGVDVSASRTISGVGVAAAGTAKDLQVLSTGTLKFVGAAGAAGIASVGLAGTLGVGLGAAFAGVGVAAALMNKNVAKEFKGLGQGIKNQLSAAAKPVQDSMLQLFKYISTSIKTMGPLFHTFFAAVAPLVTIIGKGLVGAVANLIGEFTPLVKIVTPIVNELFNQLPDLIGNIAFALKSILQPLSGNTSAFGMLLQTLGSLLPIVGSIIGSLVRLGQQIMPVFSRSLLAVGTALDSGLMKVLPLVGKAIQVMLPPVAQLISALLGMAAKVLPVLLPPLSRLVGLLAGALAKILPTLLPPFLQLIGIFGQLVKVVQPIIPPLAALALWVSRAVSNIIPPLLAVVAAIIGALMPAIKGLLPVLLQVANQVGGALADAFKAAAPSLVQLAKAASQILVALTPLIPVVVKTLLSFAPLIPVVADIAGTLAKGLVPIVLALTPLLIFLAPTLVKLAIATKLWAVAQVLLNVAMSLNPLGLVVVAVIAVGAALIYAYQKSETFRKIVTAVFNAIKTAIRVTVDFIITVIKGWFNAQATVVIGIISLFAKLPGPMGAPFRALKGVAETARNNVNRALDGIKRTVDVTFQGHDKVNPVIRQIQSEMKAHGYSVTARLIRGGTYAKGGLLPGYGGGDVLPLWGEPGEAIVPKDKAKRPEFMAWAKGMGIPGFASGGVVGWPADVNLAASRDALMSRLMLGVGGSANVNAVAMRTLQLLGRPLAELGAWIRRIMFESGGNASVVNRTDSNWFAGHPSVGLAQVIRGTFAAWAGPFRGVGPFLYGVSVNPLANSYAGANYAVHRYGSLFAVDPQVRHAGYDRGGVLQPGLTLAYNGTGRPEPVGGGHGGDLHLHMHIGTVIGGDPQRVGPQLLQAMKDDLRRRGKGKTADLL
jgi:phage-related protein